MDDSIGQIAARLRELGLLEHALIIFASDNGPSDEVRTKLDPKGPRPGSSGPFRGSKFSLLEGGIRMPCIASWPGHIEAGSVYDEPAIAMDALPTIAAAAGAKCPEGIEGRNDLAEGDEPKDRPLLWESGGQRAIRRGNWKLYVPQKGQPQLYDLAADPGEAKDLSTDKAELVRELLALHDAWRATWAKK
jgi:arylsulfatase A-like enzyme